jgi:putative hydrolase of the HAD superfamily
MEELWKQHGIWKQYETGLVDDAGFRAAVRSLVRSETDEPDRWADQIIDQAWNSVLLNVPVERIERIRSLQGKYRLFLLSNTNPIHIREVDIRLAELGLPPLESLFEQVYYSHIVRMLKPNPDIYGYVLKQANLEASETLFLDDNALNIQAAAALGIRAVQVVPPKTILDYLDEIEA